MPEDIQTILDDDFEQSLKESGIEIIIPEEDSEQPDGVGAVGYSPRLTAPSATNPYFLKYGRGGYNRCILITGNSCIPNCVGYAYGRSLEIGGVTSNPKLPTCNAEDWLAMAKANGLETGSTPKVGAVVVWKSGKLWNGNDGCGHVGVVEEVAVDGTITVSQSNYGGTRFFVTKHKPPYNIYGQTFIGFIYSPYYTGEPHWVKNDTGWWYDNGDGTYPANRWKLINNKWYWFNEHGYMGTGWLSYKGRWYYLDENGVMATGWRKIKGKWYFMDSEGIMLTGWVHYKDKWYFCNERGEMLTGKQMVPAYFAENGELVRK